MKKLDLITISALAVFGLVACGGSTVDSTNTTSANRTTVTSTSNNPNAGNTPDMGNLSSADTDFMNKAAQGGMAEVELGKLAATKGQSAEVKNFGQQMDADHTKANSELKTLAAEKKAVLPTDVGATHKATIDKLSKLSGAQFDKEYVKEMVEDHEKDVADFQKQADSGTNADLKSFAVQTLPTLKSHLAMIKTIQTGMK